MAYLNSNQRSFLERSVISARKAAESGAVNALKALAINHHEPYGSMDQDKRALRNRLRYKGRLLGDTLENNGTQQIDNLATELAYEYWHKMLFAKFLEVNGLLMHPDGVPVSLQECEELAPAENFVDKWHAASVYASKMLPAIFRPEDPIMAVEYAAEDRIKLESILEAIPNETFTADDSLGWVYQFWQSEAKDAINKSGDKIDGKKLPAVTQLFTEPYMVHFLIDNSIGAWWVSRNPGVTPPVEFKYLRYLDDGTPAAGKFEGWPNKTRDITSLDPCMGSGHFIVAQFDVFVKLRMYEEGLTAEEAAKSVISENLHGLELDPRCTQIAAFNLALATWKFVGKFIQLPEMNLACSGVAPRGGPEEWIKLIGNDRNDSTKTRLTNGMQGLYEHFQLAPILGSLLDPSRIESDAFTASYDELRPILLKALEFETDTNQIEIGVIANGIARAGSILQKKFVLAITNVPYLVRGKQDNLLMNYCLSNYPEAKIDLATVFIKRIFDLLINGGSNILVSPQNWMFLSSYKLFRENIIKSKRINFIAQLGAGAFNEISGEFVKVILTSISKDEYANNYFFGIDEANISSAAEKDKYLSSKQLVIVNQKAQLENPDSRIVIDFVRNKFKLLSYYSNCYIGMHVGDWDRFRRFIWEVFLISSEWDFLQNNVSDGLEYEGLDALIYWPNDGKIHIDNPNARVQGRPGWQKKGIAISMMADLQTSLYLGSKLRNGVSALIPKDDIYLAPIWTYIKSGNYVQDVRRIDPNLYVTTSTLIKVPFDFEYWQKIAEEKYPNGLPRPYSDDPTQWLYHGHPIKTEAPLQVAVARFLGYRWPAESDDKMELAEEARELIKDIKQYDSLSDEDGIVCIPSVNGELAAAERIREYLSKVFGSQWGHNTLEDLLKKENAKSSTLETWLREEFFEQQYKLFNNRPFIWQIWDGRKDGFSVLVNYHKLTKENLQKLIYTYLGDWIRQCEMKVKNGESGADGLLLAAQKLKEKLELILKGEDPYDIFVRWKKLEEQPVGWDPDINDGVRLNIRPFMQADVLRKKPNIKWGVDRGKNPPGSPWGEVRDNDRHLSLKEKLEARG